MLKFFQFDSLHISYNRIISIFFQQDSDRKVVKFMEVEYKSHKKCAKSYNIDPPQLTFAVECLKPTKDQNRFKQVNTLMVSIRYSVYQNFRFIRNLFFWKTFQFN